MSEAILPGAISLKSGDAWEMLMEGSNSTVDMIVDFELPYETIKDYTALKFNFILLEDLNYTSNSIALMAFRKSGSGTETARFETQFGYSSEHTAGTYRVFSPVFISNIPYNGEWCLAFIHPDLAENSHANFYPSYNMRLAVVRSQPNNYLQTSTIGKFVVQMSAI